MDENCTEMSWNEATDAREMAPWLILMLTSLTALSPSSTLLQAAGIACKSNEEHAVVSLSRGFRSETQQEVLGGNLSGLSMYTYFILVTP